MALDESASRLPTRVRAAGAVAAAVLIVLGIAYYFTHEPAPRIRVQWADGVGRDLQEGLEREYLLVDRLDYPDRSEYDLLDTSRRNLRALVGDPRIRDTDRIDRNNATIPFDAPYGQSWMWAAHRVPILRIPGVVEWVVVGCVAVVAAAIGAWLEGRRIARVTRSRPSE